VATKSTRVHPPASRAVPQNGGRFRRTCFTCPSLGCMAAGSRLPAALLRRKCAELALIPARRPIDSVSAFDAIPAGAKRRSPRRNSEAHLFLWYNGLRGSVAPPVSTSENLVRSLPSLASRTRVAVGGEPRNRALAPSDRPDRFYPAERGLILGSPTRGASQRIGSSRPGRKATSRWSSSSS
jgi:hypothetical protein